MIKIMHAFDCYRTAILLLFPADEKLEKSFWVVSTLTEHVEDEGEYNEPRKNHIQFVKAGEEIERSIYRLGIFAFPLCTGKCGAIF